MALEDYVDGLVLVSNNTEEIVKQVVDRDGENVCIINAWHPIDINEIYPGWEVMHWTQVDYIFSKLACRKPKFHLSQIVYHYGKTVYVKHRFMDFNDNHWRYVIASKHGSGTSVVKERKLRSEKGLLKDLGR